MVTQQGPADMDQNPDPRIVRLAELEIDPAQLAAYAALLREEIEASVRTEPGVLALYATCLVDNPAAIRLTEIYADQAAYAAHLLSPHFLKYKQQTAEMVLSLRLIAVQPLLLAAKTLQQPTAGAGL